MEYNTALCDFLKLPPDPCLQKYSAVTTHVYPLRADLDNLKEFCQDYLNKSDFEIFEPAGPWVIMQVCAYGRMEFDKPPPGQYAHRWFAQHEVAFGIPVRCIEKKNGNRREFGLVYPFIFVDNPLSMEGGRQVYGWPKAGIELQAALPEFQPNQPHSLISVKLSPFTLTTDRQATADSPFVEIYQTRPFLSGRTGIVDALSSIPRIINGYFSIASSVLEGMSRLAGRVAGYDLQHSGSLLTDFAALGSEVRSLVDTMQTGFGYFSAMLPMLLAIATGRRSESSISGAPLKMSIYTMKQVRDAENTKTACYQAIVRSEMAVDAITDGGLLFDPLSGDPSGGVEIKLHSKGNDYMTTLVNLVSSKSDANDMHCVRPLMPFWQKMDLSYGLANRQSWRTKQTAWHDESIATLPGTGAAGRKGPAKKPQVIAYEKRGSGSALAVSGERKATDAVMHVFMIPTDKQDLDKLVDSYLNTLTDAQHPRFKFTVKDWPYVYVTLLTYDKMSIDKLDVYGDSVLSFLVLVDYDEALEATGELSGKPVDAFIPLYTFVGTDWNFVTEYEVYGRLAFKSTMVSPSDAWVRQPAPTTREVLSVSTTLFPAQPDKAAKLLKETKGALAQKIVGISSMPDLNLKPDVLNFDSADQGKIQTFLDQFGLAKYLSHAKMLDALEPMSIALKQVRNAMSGGEADYQSIVAIKRSFKLKGDGTHLKGAVKIYKREGFPILRNLGLEGKGRVGQDADGDYEEYVAEELAFIGDLVEHPGEERWLRVAPDLAWTKGA